nr:Mu-like prophage major head subunit gpT family protein [Bacteroidota bacterium]
MVTLRADFIGALKVDLYGTFFETYQRFDTMYDKIFEVVPSTGAYAQSFVTTGMGDLLERPEGDDIVFEKLGGGRMVIGKNRTFSKGIEITQETIEDSSEEVIRNLVTDKISIVAESYVRSKEKWAARFFNKGGIVLGDNIFNNTVAGITDPTGNLTYDGKPFFNLAGNPRSSLGGGTYFNGHALALSAANLQAVYTNMVGNANRDENDDFIDVKPTTLLIPPGLHFTAKPILESEKVLGSNNNDPNPVANLVNLMEWSYLTDADAWFLGVPKRGLKWTDRRKPVIDIYQNPINRNYLVTVDARWGAWMDNFR